MRISISVALGVLFTIVSSVSTAQEGQLDPASRIQKFERFDGTTMMREMASDGSITAESGIHVDIHNWMIGGGVRLEDLIPERQGLMIVQLRNGEVTTIVNGERVERREGEFWTIPDGVQMGIETEDDSAILQTVVVGEG